MRHGDCSDDLLLCEFRFTVTVITGVHVSLSLSHCCTLSATIHVGLSHLGLSGISGAGLDSAILQLITWRR